MSHILCNTFLGISVYRAVNVISPLLYIKPNL